MLNQKNIYKDLKVIFVFFSQPVDNYNDQIYKEIKKYNFKT